MGTNEEAVRRVVDAAAFDIPAMAELRGSLDNLISVVPAALQPAGWTGATAEAARATSAEIVRRFGQVNDVLAFVDKAISDANAATARAAAALESLPGVKVDPKFVEQAKSATHINFMGIELNADGAVDAIANILGNQREEKAKEVNVQLERELTAQANALIDSRSTLSQIDGLEIPPIEEEPETPSSETPTPSRRTPPSTPYYPTPDSGGGLYGTGGGTETGTVLLPPVGPRPPIVISDPVFVHPEPPTPTFPTGPTPDGSLGDGTVPGTGPGTGGSGSGGGGLQGGIGGGGGLGSGLIGGGAGAAALAAAKLGGGSGAGSLSGAGGAGGMGGAGGKGFGGAGGSGAGGRLGGGGLLGGAQSGGSTGAAGGAGGAGGSGSTTGAAAGGRGGTGMMGGGAGNDDEREKRSGLGGPLAPKLDDESDMAPRSTGASAGGRTPRPEK